MILLPLRLASLTHKNPKRCKIIYGMDAQIRTCHDGSNVLCYLESIHNLPHRRFKLHILGTILLQKLETEVSPFVKQ